MSSLHIPTLWQRIYWPGGFTPESALALLRQLASDRRRWPVVFEARAHGGHVDYFVGSQRRGDVAGLGSTAGVFLVDGDSGRADHEVSGRLKITPTRVRLGVQPLESVVRSLLATLAQTGPDEFLTLQVVLGAAQPPHLAAKRPPAGREPAPFPERLLHGHVHADEGHTTATNKAESHVFAADIRIGASSSGDGNAKRLLLGLLPAFRLIERAHARIAVTPYRADRLRDPLLHPRMRLRLNLEETLALLAWPIAPDLPGQPAAHPKPLAPRGPAVAAATTRVFGKTAAPGIDKSVGIPAEEARFHTLVLGPTGSGKSTVLLNLITRDLLDNRSVVVVDPKADLIRDTLARIPEQRIDDVVVLDPSSPNPVGFNPLARGGLPPHLVADHALSVLAGLFAPLGPRTYDLLNASLLTLTYANRPLTDLPPLLTDHALRWSVVGSLPADSGLEGFWAQFESYSPQQAAEVIGPTLSRLRQLLLRPGIRSMLSGQQASFSLDELFTRPRILLVPLNKGITGAESARLVGALLTSSLWQTALAQAAKPQRMRRPVHIYVDEVQDNLRVGTDLAEALAQSRSLGVAWHLAHQYRKQLTPDVRAAIDSNARNKIVFGVSSDDAHDLAQQAPELDAADFMALPSHAVYAQLTRSGTPQPWVSVQTLRAPREMSDPVEVLARAQARYATATPPPAAEEAAQPPGPATRPDEPVGRRPRRRP